MRADRYSPHAAIEDHYHIQELMDAQALRAADRTHHQDRVKLAHDRDNEIAQAKGKDIKAFWCNTCRADFVSETVKQVETDWTNTAQSIAFYRTKCFKGHWCTRLITDPHKDGYWTKSHFVNLDRGQHSLDTIQPHETGFNTLYKKI